MPATAIEIMNRHGTLAGVTGTGGAVLAAA
jgi:hypothetical protein